MLRHRLLKLLMVALLLAAVMLSGIAVVQAAWVVRVPADAGWIGTGLSMTPGQPLTFSAVGRAITGPLRDFPDAKSGPDGQFTPCTTQLASPCALDGAPYGALIGKIGASGTPFVMGANITLDAPATGELYLAVNDNVDFYGDNHGTFVIRLR